MRYNPEQVEQSIIEEDVDFESMLAENERKSESGGIQEGEIVRIDQDYAMIAVEGAKQEGRLPLGEIQDQNGVLLFKVGDKIQVYVSFSSERPNVSYKRVLKAKRFEEKVQELGENFADKIVDGKIVKKNKGGYVVEFDGVEAFLPRFAAALREDGKHLGRVLKMCVTEIKPKDQTIILSRKRFLDLDDQSRQKRLDGIMENEGIQEGVVKKITPFGIFVEVDGIEGLVHYTELSHRGPVNPANLYKVGDSVNVKVLGYDKDKKRLSFSIKATSEDPWKEIENQLDVGDQIQVRVSNIEDYGAFVDLGNGAEGFLHISEISWSKNIAHPSEFLSQNQSLNVEIIEIDPQRRRLRVSLKRLAPKPFGKFVAGHKVGDIVEGEIVKIVDFGIFVSLGEVDGLLHNEDISWDKSKSKQDFKVGEKIRVKIIKLDETNEKISLSLKALEESPIDLFAKSHQVDDKVSGKIIDIKEFGVFVDLGEGVEALVRNEDLYPVKKDEIALGDELSCAVAFIDRNHGKVRASVRRLERLKEIEQLNGYNGVDTKMTLGDKIKLN